MAALVEVRFDKATGKMCYVNNLTKKKEFRDPTSMGRVSQSRRQEDWEGWEGSEEWGPEDGEYEEEAPIDDNYAEEETLYQAPQRFAARPPKPVLKQPAQTLPPHWERQVDPQTGRLFYVNHQDRTTSWSPPPPERPAPKRPWAPKAQAPKTPRGAAGAPARHPDNDVLREMAELKAQQDAIQLRMELLQQKIEGPQSAAAAPYSTSSADGSFNRSAPSARPKPKPQAKPLVKAAAVKQPRSEDHCPIPWPEEDIMSFTSSAGIDIEGVFERFCRRQLRELPGVELADCQAHWLVLDPEELSDLIATQPQVLARAKNIFTWRMRSGGMKDGAFIGQRWQSLPWAEKQPYLEEAEGQVDAGEPAMKAGR